MTTHLARRGPRVLLAASLLLGAVSLSSPPTPAMAASAVTTVSELDAGSPPWRLASGPGTMQVVANPKSSGSGATSIAYDFTKGNQVQIAPSASPADLPGLPRRISLDVHGDASWNVIYLQVQDATGEIFHYRLGNASHSGWATMSVEPGRVAPAATMSGDGDGVLDLPVRPFRIIVDRNPGGTKSTSTIVVDRLVAEYEDGSPLRVDTKIFVPGAGQATNLRVALAEAGDFAVLLVDEGGRMRTWSGAASPGAESVLRWNGRDDGGALMRGAVSARLSVTRGADTWRYDVPYLAGLPIRLEPGIPGSIAGINSTMMQQSTAKRAAAASQAQLMEDAWVRMAREGFDWNRVEPRKGWFEWSVFDQAVEVARAHNIGIVGVLGYSAAWASSAPATAIDRQFYPPTSNADFAAYARAVVSRYKDRVRVWEIWNEPNLATFWKPSPNASAYTAMLKAAYAAIKAEDPGATVLIGGLAASELAYLGGIHAAGGWNSFDAIAIHTYVAPQPETSMIPTWLDNVRAFAQAKGDKPIWITELGWSTYSGSGTGYIGVTEAQQAQYLARSYLMAARVGVRGVFAYSLIEYGTSSTSKLHNYGLVEQDGRKKPGYGALRRVAEALDQGTTAGVADPMAGSRVTASTIDTISGWTASPLGGGSARISRVTDVRHGGTAAMRVDYAFTSTSTGVELRRNLALPGSPTSVSVWVHGDGSANPVYIKIADKTGETFQGAVGTLQRGWQRLTLYADGADINWKHGGGDNDGRFDYPLTLQSIFVFRGGIGQLSGVAHFDDVQVNHGARVRGTVISRRNGNVQSLYTLAPPATVSVPMPGTNAWLVDGSSSPRLTLSGGKVSVALGAMPVNVLGTVGITPSTLSPGGSAKLTWAGGDRTRATFQIIDGRTGVVVRHVWVDRWFDAGLRVATWDGRIAGSPAPSGPYRLRLAIHGPDGRVSYLFGTVVVQ